MNSRLPMLSAICPIPDKIVLPQCGKDHRLELRVNRKCPACASIDGGKRSLQYSTASRRRSDIIAGRCLPIPPHSYWEFGV